MTSTFTAIRTRDAKGTATVTITVGDKVITVGGVKRAALPYARFWSAPEGSAHYRADGAPYFQGMSSTPAPATSPKHGGFWFDVVVTEG